MNYSRTDLQFPERFRYGFTPEKSKKADLMFVQHMLSVTRHDGLVATVMPHGVLFRLGDEGKIRSAMLRDDVVEAVIGLGPQLFYGTGIPACVLILRPAGTKPAERKGKVLFINADREFREGRAQNYLEPEHIEKIVSAFREYVDVPKFARVVTISELRENDDNLNIRRYVDSTPPPEPDDVRAHLHGGVPKAEVLAKHDLFAAHGLKAAELLPERDDDYVDFPARVSSSAQLRALVEAKPGVAAAEQEITKSVETWWLQQSPGLDALQGSQGIFRLRKELLATFESALRPTPMLDRFEVAGIVASWWALVLPDLKTLSSHGYAGLIDAWKSTVLDALEEENSTVDPLDHKLSRALLPEYLEALAGLESRVAGLASELKIATSTFDDGEEVEDDESVVDVGALRKDLTSAKKQLRSERAAFASNLSSVADGLSPHAARDLVLQALRADLLRETELRISRHRRMVVEAFEAWWRKYAVTFEDLESRRLAASRDFNRLLKDLGYE